MGNTETRHWDVTHGGSWLVQKASSQIYRNREGFNLYPLTAYWEFKAAKARIGFITKNANNCIDVDTRIGFGTRGPHDDNNTCEIVADESGLDNGSKFIKAMGYILVQWRAEIVHIVINNVNITTLINNNNEKLRKKDCIPKYTLSIFTEYHTHWCNTIIYAKQYSKDVFTGDENMYSKRMIFKRA